MKPREVEHVLALRRHLQKHDEWLSKSQAKYKQYLGTEIEELEFQTKLVEQALMSSGVWNAELATGIGKTIIAARIALKKIKEGPVIYICASPTALGDAESGIINKFVRVFHTFGEATTAIGERNDISRANDVSFLTPAAFVKRLDKDPLHMEKLLNSVSLFVVDEAHHFPQDTEKELKIYGRIYDVARQMVKKGLVVSMTGTWERLDRKVVMGSSIPDARMTVQNAVDLGRCPEIYAIQVILDIIAKGSKSVGDLYDYHLQGDERTAYYGDIAECMAVIYEKYPVPFAAFARTQSDAREIAKCFNKMMDFTQDNGLVALTSRTPMKKRQTVVNDILDGRRSGYITCAVGEEALDLPPLEVVHLIRRTRSAVRNAQAVGRALRLYDTKKRALIVDYQMMVQGMVGRFVGLNVDDLVEPIDSRVPRVVNGGPLVVQRDIKEGEIEGMTMEQERALVIRNNMTAEQLEAERDKEEWEERRKQWQAERIAERPGKLKKFSDMATAFLTAMNFQSHTRNPKQTDIFRMMPVYPEHSFPDAGIRVDWWPTKHLDTKLDQVCAELEKHNSWRGYWNYEEQFRTGGKAPHDTLDMLFTCYLMTRKDKKDHFVVGDLETWSLDRRQESEHYEVDLPIAVILGAFLCCLKDGTRLDSLFWEELGALDQDKTYRGEILREYLRSQVPRELFRDVHDCVMEIFRVADFGWWHHSQTQVLPGYIDTDVLKLYRVRNIEDFAAMAGHLWNSMRHHFQPVIIIGKRGPRLVREPAPEPVDFGNLPSLSSYPPQYNSADSKKKDLLERAKRDDYPSIKTEKKIYQLFMLYIKPGSKVYDAEFVKQLREINPDWLSRSRKFYDEDGQPREVQP